MARNEAFIAAPPHDVFAILSDPRTYSEWVPGSSEVHSADPSWPADGSDFDHSVVLGISDHTSVCAATVPVMLELRARARPFISAQITFQLQPDGEGTRITMIEDPANRVLGVLLGPLGHGLIKLRNVETLRRLRALAEGKQARGTGEPPARPPR